MLDRLSHILRDAGALLLERRSRGAFTFEREAASVHASVDIEAHDLLVRGLAMLTPGVPVLSEEDAASRSAGGRPDKYWLIDPLDGTASFVDGYPGFVTQAALMERRRPVLSGVYAPLHEQMFLAETGAGATCNGSRCKVEGRPIRESTIIDNYAAPRGVAAELMRAWHIGHYLECGSIGLKVCRIADGTADLFVKDVTVRDWDLAAPHLVLEEAGGVLSDARGQPIPYAGVFERNGVIACTSSNLSMRLSAWLRQRETT